ncbi:MAG: hypothetical protein Q7S98_01355, partial [Deltaproteobacteria bacterium]|nr:hypothetical protein [Deltaproteobacteria bacterium]
TKMKEALLANHLPEVVQGIIDLRSVLRYAQESDIVFPNKDSNQYANKEVLEILMKDYNQMAQEIRLALADFEKAKKGDTQALASGVVHYKNFLRYVREEYWNGLASGLGPLRALRELRLAAALHLGQDSVAHCRQWEGKRGDVCQEIVAVNLFGWGTLHDKDDDRIEREDGSWKPATQLAVAISFQIRKLSHTAGELFEEKKKAFLDRFWPVD